MATLRRCPSLGGSALKSSRSDIPSSSSVALNLWLEPANNRPTVVPAAARTRSARRNVPLTGRAIVVSVIEIAHFESHDFTTTMIFFCTVMAGHATCVRVNAPETWRSRECCTRASRGWPRRSDPSLLLLSFDRRQNLLEQNLLLGRVRGRCCDPVGALQLRE